MSSKHYPQCVFNPENVAQKPDDSKFFLGETVLHTGDGQMYTICGLGSYYYDYYHLWPLGHICAVPTHGSYGRYLESISTELTNKQRNK